MLADGDISDQSEHVNTNNITGPTRFELAIFGLTGRRVNQATPRPRVNNKYFSNYRQSFQLAISPTSRSVLTSSDAVGFLTLRHREFRNSGSYIYAILRFH